MERVSFSTEDGQEIVGLYASGVSGKTALLLHMMPATKESWVEFAERLVKMGFTVLAIDERGHGESVHGPEGKVLNYKDFSDTEQQLKKIDLEAAINWLESKGSSRDRLALVGASIGANLVIEYAGRHSEVSAVAGLSAGLAYCGIEIAESLRKMPREQKVLLAVSDNDAYAFQSIEELRKAKEDIEVHVFKGAGHGTDMFESAPGFLDFLAAWVDLNLH